MKNPFDLLDQWKSSLNIFSDPVYLGDLAKRFALYMIPVCLILGYDSGVGMIEEAIKFLPDLLNGEIFFSVWIDNVYGVYGRSFHFTSYLIYGLLFYGLTKHFYRLGLRGSRNVFFSGFLVALNVAVFEWVYMTLFAVYQTRRNLLEWIVTDWWFLQQYALVLLLGLLGWFAVYLESYGEIKRVYKFKFDPKILLVLIGALLAWSLWIYYPFPVETFMVGEWTSSTLFPQTDYAYFGKVYIENNLLHTFNLFAKGFLAGLQLIYFRGFKKCS